MCEVIHFCTCVCGGSGSCSVIPYTCVCGGSGSCAVFIVCVVIICSTSDVENVAGESQLVLVEPDPGLELNASFPGNDHQPLLSQLSQMIADQKEMFCKVEADQERVLAALRSDIKTLKKSLVEEQNSSFAEFKQDQRILFCYSFKYYQSLYSC